MVDVAAGSPMDAASSRFHHYKDYVNIDTAKKTHFSHAASAGKQDALQSTKAMKVRNAVRSSLGQARWGDALAHIPE